MRHPVNVAHHDDRTRGERAADSLASVVGSWKFIGIQNVGIFFWGLLNLVAWFHHWDPYPFILLNLMLSWQAANTGPVLQMSGNRQSRKDRDRLEHDFAVNRAGLRVLRRLATAANVDVENDLAEVSHLIDVEEGSVA